MKRHNIFIVLIAGVIVWQMHSLFAQGFFPMHDDTQVARVVEMGRALREGQFPVRWVSDLGYGYGYPLFNFYGPLPYYAGGLMYALGANSILATKGMFLLGALLAGIVMYLFLATVAGRAAAVCGALLFSFAPYHAVQLFVRGAVGEYWATIFLPLIFWGVLEIHRARKKKGILLGAIGISGTMLSHTLLGFFTFGIVGIALLVIAMVAGIRKDWREQCTALVIMFVTGVSLSAFFWLPAIMEMNYTSVAAQIGGTADFHDHFVCLGQFWESLWGFGGSAKGCTDGLSFAIGKILIVASFFGAIAAGIMRKFSLAVWLSILIGVGSILMMLPVSEFIWNSIPPLSYLQYPWRLLSFTIVGFTVLPALGIAVLPSKSFRVLCALLLITAAMIQYSRWFRPQYIYSKNPSAFETSDELRYRVSKISDEYLPPGVPHPENVYQIPRDTIERKDTVMVKTVIERDTYKKYEVTAKGKQTLRVNLTPFPGWQYVVNGQEVRPIIDNGLPLLTVPDDFSTIELTFRNTPIREISTILSSTVLVLLVFIYGKKTIA